MKFTPIDPQTWPRSQVFYYFSKMAPTDYSMTVEVDVTGLRKKLKQRGLKFFPTYLWLVTKCLNRQPEFKTAVQNGELGYYDVLTPLYAQFHSDTKTFSLMWTEFCDDLEIFCRNYEENQKQYGENHGVLSQQEMLPPPNAYTVSAIPWVSFRHFAVHSYGEPKDYYFPSVEAGKIRETGERELLPLSLTCHHAATDGWHIRKFLDDLQAEIDLLRM